MGSRHVSDVYDGGWGIRDSASCGDGGDATGRDLDGDCFVRRTDAQQRPTVQSGDDRQRLDHSGGVEFLQRGLHVKHQDGFHGGGEHRVGIGHFFAGSQSPEHASRDEEAGRDSGAARGNTDGGIFVGSAEPVKCADGQQGEHRVDVGDNPGARVLGSGTDVWCTDWSHELREQ